MKTMSSSIHSSNWSGGSLSSLDLWIYIFNGVIKKSGREDSVGKRSAFIISEVPSTN